MDKLILWNWISFRMFKIKLSVIAFFAFCALLLASCAGSKSKGAAIADSKRYEASLFRQNCAICHGAEAEGRTLDDGKLVPSLRSGDFKFKSEAEIYRQIAQGGNGMTPFGRLLTERELQMMSEFVYKDLRGN